MNDADREKHQAFLQEFCAAHLAEDALDDLVHELKGSEAAAINNGGAGAQLEYILERLGAVEAARAVMGECADLPDVFRAGAAPLPERSWRVAYRVCATDGETIHSATVAVVAPTEAEAGKKAVHRAHDHDPFCDARIDYHVEIVHVEATEEGDDDEPDYPAG